MDTGVYRTWPQVGAARLSSDGRYVAYEVTNPMASPNQLVIQATDSKWKVSFVFQHTPDPGIFTFDSQYAIFKRNNDTLEMIDLKTRRSQALAGVGTLNVQSKGHWICYSTTSPFRHFFLKNTSTGEQVRIDSADRIEMPQQGNIIYYWTNSTHPDHQRLFEVDLSKHQHKLLWIGRPLGELVFSSDDRLIAFCGKSDSTDAADIWYYHAITDKKPVKQGFDRIARPQRIKLLSIDDFDGNSKTLFVTTQKDTILPEIKKIKTVPLDVWSYTDYKMQPVQDATYPEIPSSHGLFMPGNTKLIPIVRENENIVLKNQAYTLVIWTDPRYNLDDARFCPYGIKRYYLVSNNDGSSRMNVPPNFGYAVSFSPRGKYFIFIDTAGHYCSYEMATGLVFNLTKNVATEWKMARIDSTASSNVPREVFSSSNSLWASNDSSLLVYDRYDIWQLDPAGKRPPVNITNGYGKYHHIQFDLAINYKNIEIKVGRAIILKAFNIQTKESGFFQAEFGRSADPVKLSMGRYKYFRPDNGPWRAADDPLSKTANSNLYLIGRMSAEESPNYFVTTDFKSFKPVTGIYPEKSYDWMTTELVNWKEPDGTTLQGVLYKPKNFDTHRKYPLIFSYYEHLADGLNAYQTPEPTGVILNPSLYTANGYLVFYPDISKRTGGPGQSACDAVVSAAHYLSQRSYIDSTKLGLYGMSFGGYETNYIITHSNLFAAAGSNSGMSDFVSGCGELDELGNGVRNQQMYAFGQEAMGQYLWENPERYLEESPVAYAGRVSTPVLLMANKRDNAVNFDQGVQFFTALRTLGKKVWLLQYDKGEHGIDFLHHPDDAIDFDVRLKQFFDFYLMGKAAPRWMLEGIPRYLKGTTTGLKLDRTGKVPGPGLPQLRAESAIDERVRTDGITRKP